MSHYIPQPYRLGQADLTQSSQQFCADTGIVRSEDRRELLYARSAVVLAAKAYGLSAIDLVCIVSLLDVTFIAYGDSECPSLNARFSTFQHYQDMDVLKEECEEGRKLGFDAKQIIHPAQISTIQSAFSPSSQGED